MLYIAAKQIGRKAYGFEIKKDFYNKALKFIDEYTAQGALFI